MKNHFLLAFALIVFISACAKKDQGCMPVSPQSEEPQIKAYATANSITATKDNSGMYYQIIDAGTGVAPTVNSKVYITYTGKFLNGTQFNQSTDPSTTGWKLEGLIEGWQIGLPLIKKGGHIKLIIPSSLAYGCNPVKDPNTGDIDIPGNSVLYFDINLIDVK